jgi:3-oxoacyl-[acyl-carrier protein] reductase
VTDRVVVVTGAAAGIGRATAVRFGEGGARVAVWDVNEENGRGVAQAIEAAGGVARFDRVNVADAGDVTRAMDAVLAAWGRVDVLVNNAGIVRDAMLAKFKDGDLVSTMTDEQWDDVIGVNLRGVFNCGRAAVPHMVRQGGGVVLNASSVVALYGNFGQTNYAATKGGVILMTKTWARELGRHRIRVNAVAPGFVETEILKSVPEKVIAGMIARTPMGRLGRPEDIAEAYVWLASDAASFVSGAVLSVDGGLVIGT